MNRIVWYVAVAKLAGEKRRDVDVEYSGEGRKPTRSDPVPALLVFLNLLERDVELVRHIGLAHPLGEPEATDLLTNVSIDVMSALLASSSRGRRHHKLQPVSA